MQSYNEIEGFEYWNIEAWKKFVKDYILPLHYNATKLLKFRDFIIAFVENDKTTLSTVKEKKSEFLQFLLGGIREDGEYADSSLAKLVKLSLGIYINPKTWVTLEKEEGINSYDYITIRVEITPFFEFIKNLKEITYNIVKIVGEEDKDISDSESEEMIKRPEKLLEVVREICLKCLQVSVNYSYYTFFAISTRTIPFKYMIIAYPKLQLDFDKFKEFFGLIKIYEPQIDKNLKENYTIWGHSKGGLLDLLYELNNIIWGFFSDKIVKNILTTYVITSFTDLREDYNAKVQEALEKISWKFPDYIETSDKDYYRGCTKGCYSRKYVISGALLVKKETIGYSTRGNYWSFDEECNISLIKLIDDISPILFLNPMTYELRIHNNTLEIIK
jgi:hypothetical protein